LAAKEKKSREVAALSSRPHFIVELVLCSAEHNRCSVTHFGLKDCCARGKAGVGFAARDSGRSFDFCYGSSVKTQPLTKIKGVTATDISLVGANRKAIEDFVLTATGCFQ
jgi:hypothetical protein